VSDTPPEHPAAPAVGPLALEAALLLDVVADRLTSMKRAAAPARDQPAATEHAPSAQPAPERPAGEESAGGQPAGEQRASERPATERPAADRPTVPPAGGRCPECGSLPGASSCTACPLCRFMALLRGERPEATARLVDGALLIVRTLRSLVPDPPEPAAAGTAGTDPPPQPRRGGGLEHIDIS